MSSRGRSPPPPAGSGPGQSEAGSSSSPARSATSAKKHATPPGSESGRPAPLGFDPAKPVKTEDKGNTRMELPPDAYLSETAKSAFALRGSKLNSEGSKTVVEVNQFRMKGFNFDKKIFQYDVSISPDLEKKAVVLKKIWTHETTKRALGKYNYGMWIFDGRKLAWAAAALDRGEIRFTVDLDEGKGPPSAAGRERSNKFLIVIRQTTVVNMAALQGYLDQKMSYNTSVQTAMNFIDHLIRQFPSQNLVSIKRNFYDQSQRGQRLTGGGCVEAQKGLYASIRLSHNLAQGGIGLALNVDVANTCFWQGNLTMDAVMCMFLASCDPKRWSGLTPINITKHLQPVSHPSGGWASSDAFKQLRKLRRLRFKVQHANRQNKDKVYSIQDIHFDQQYGPEGATAKTVQFDHDGKQTCVADYYSIKYKAHLRYANLPLIDAGKGGFIPMEFAVLEPMQRYPFKLNPEQTAAMIKFAVTRPPARRQDIERGVNNLRLTQDPYLKEYGVQFEPSFTKTEARVLPAPKVDFRQGNAEPKYSGRWDLRGKKFWKPNVAPLQNWAFIVMDACVDLPQLQNFAKMFRQAFLGHGGTCPADALLLNVQGAAKHNPAEAIAWAHKQVCEKRGYTQLLFVVVQHRNSPHYERLKKSADCRFGILSQVVNSEAVRKANGQYLSNVCMKVNAKLGGATARTMPPWKSQPTFFPKDRPTMIIGVDVSHAAPGGNSPSTAAMTMSVDRDANRYAAMVETNGYRTETLTNSNIHFLFGQLIEHWKRGHEGFFPKHIIYFRDGVSEGQFSHVLEQEVEEMKFFLRSKAPKMPLPKFTVVVATKRHHVRFFPHPQQGDRNGNALPGTLVEKEVTHPFMWDFYLCSHVAIQGTARPVHYHVLLDEMNVPVNDFQKMIYHQCYSYARSTTPVSMHPSIYYAHLAGARARAHENIATSEGFRAGAKGHEIIRDKVAKGETMGTIPRGTESPALLTLGGKENPETGPAPGETRQRDFFRSTMWYI